MSAEGIDPRQVVCSEPRARQRDAKPAVGPVSWLLITLLRFYRRWFSALLGQNCRFHPTCSRYAIEALTAHGAIRGSWLSIRRLSRCHPFHAGGMDPVP